MYKSKNNSTSVADMVRTAIMTLAEPTGSSLQAIKKFIIANYGTDMEKFAPFIKDYVVSSVSAGTLIQMTGKGASGSFRLASVAIEPPKPKAKPKAETKTLKSTTQPSEAWNMPGNYTGAMMAGNPYQLSTHHGGYEMANLGHALPTPSYYEPHPVALLANQVYTTAARDQGYHEMHQVQQLQQLQITKPPKGGKKMVKTSAKQEMHQLQITQPSVGGKKMMEAAGMLEMQQFQKIGNPAGKKKMKTSAIQDMQQMQGLQHMQQLQTANVYTGGQNMINTSVMHQMQVVTAPQGVKKITKVTKTTSTTKSVKRKAEADPAQPSTPKKVKASKPKTIEVNINF